MSGLEAEFKRSLLNVKSSRSDYLETLRNLERLIRRCGESYAGLVTDDLIQLELDFDAVHDLERSLLYHLHREAAWIVEIEKGSRTFQRPADFGDWVRQVPGHDILLDGELIGFMFHKNDAGYDSQEERYPWKDRWRYPSSTYLICRVLKSGNLGAVLGYGPDITPKAAADRYSMGIKTQERNRKFTERRNEAWRKNCARQRDG